MAPSLPLHIPYTYSVLAVVGLHIPLLYLVVSFLILSILTSQHSY